MQQSKDIQWMGKLQQACTRCTHAFPEGPVAAPSPHCMAGSRQGSHRVKHLPAKCARACAHMLQSSRADQSWPV